MSCVLIQPVFFCAVCLLTFFSLLNAITCSARADTLPETSPADVCRRYTEHEEKRLRIPKNMLTALSHVESGHWNKQRHEKTAWPWTVMAQGTGRYYPEKKEAVQAVQNLLSEGVRNIDVGCMQVNLKYHPHAFHSLADAFDPQKNVAYAAHFLKSLQEETGSWARAATRYHSATPLRAKRYGGILVDAWNAINRQSHDVTPSSSVLSAPDHPLLGPTPSATDTRAHYSSQQTRALAHQEEKRRRARENLLRAQNAAKRFAEEWRQRRLTDYLSHKHPAPRTTQFSGSSTPEIPHPSPPVPASPPLRDLAAYRL